jgi:hypothetical protein
LDAVLVLLLDARERLCRWAGLDGGVLYTVHVSAGLKTIEVPEGTHLALDEDVQERGVDVVVGVGLEGS